MSSQPQFRLSVLDLSPVPSGSTSGQALQNTLDLAPFVEGLGYTRFWLAEHHNTGLLACSSPEILISQVAARTSTLRVGSGGVMLPNHAPLKVAENFRTLEALFPRRIDLGLGRAPGTDPRTAVALRGTREALRADDFPSQLEELQRYLADVPTVDRVVRAMPAGVEVPEIWLLGSSDFGAQLAAQRGLGFVFAHHINQSPALAALRFYHENFQPSESLNAPRAMLTVAAVCAETDEAAEELAGSANLVWLRFQQGRFGDPLPSVQQANAYQYSEVEREFLEASRERMFVGSPETIRNELGTLAAQCGVEEIMVTSLIHDHTARKRSYELLARAFEVQSTVEIDRTLSASGA
ncbi:MAG TPA: LLM class flavin-dependent oxidoreductase [Abditibacteriaceae bacterium]|jgi:luciferase family oxidoreductase group 1